MRKVTAFLCLFAFAALAQFGALSAPAFDTSHYEQTVEKSEQIKEEMDKLNYQVDQTRDFLVVLFGDHGMPDPFEEKDTSGDNANTLEGSLSAAEEAEANKHLGNFLDLPDTVDNLLGRCTELLPTVTEDLTNVAEDIESNPAATTELVAIQDKLNEANTNLQGAVEQLPMIQADVATMTTILQAVLGS